MEQMYNIPTRK